jgi:hypothetical protein
MAPLPGAPSHDSATLSGMDQAYIQPSALPEHSAVKVQEHDLTLLYQPSQKPIFADVIFVHGLQDPLKNVAKGINCRNLNASPALGLT